MAEILLTIKYQQTMTFRDNKILYHLLMLRFLDILIPVTYIFRKERLNNSLYPLTNQG